MGRRPSFKSSTKMDRLFQGNERAKQGLLSKKLTSQESIDQLCIFADASQGAFGACAYMDGWMPLFKNKNKQKP